MLRKMDGDPPAASAPIGQLGILLSQVAIVFSQRFWELQHDSQIIHISSAACVLVSVVAAVWRRARRTPRLFRLSAIGLPLGIAGDSFVVVRMLSDSRPFAALAALLVVTLSLGPWLVSSSDEWKS